MIWPETCGNVDNYDAYLTGDDTDDVTAIGIKCPRKLLQLTVIDIPPIVLGSGGANWFFAKESSGNEIDTGEVKKDHGMEVILSVNFNMEIIGVLLVIILVLNVVCMIYTCFNHCKGSGKEHQQRHVFESYDSEVQMILK